MPVRPTYPGVYIEEIPSGVRPITGVATSTAAFVGTFRKGLLNEAVRLLSLADFEREYGGIERNSEASYAVQQFFLNGGSEAWVVRVGHDGVGAGTVAIREASILLRSQITAAGVDVVNVRAGRRIRGASATNPGEWGNALRVEVEHNGVAPEATFNLTVSEVRVDGDRTVVVNSETYSDLTMEPNRANSAIEVVNQASQLVQLDRNGLAALPSPAPRPAASGAVGNDVAAAIPSLASFDDIEVRLSFGGPAPAGFPISLKPFITDTPASFPAWAQILESAIRQAGAAPGIDAALRPYLTGATVRIIGAGTATDPRRFVIRAGFGARPYNAAALLTIDSIGGGTDATSYGFPAPAARRGPQQFVPGAALGNDGTILNAGVYSVPTSVFRGSPVLKSGIYALDDVDLFNVLAIPDAPRLGEVNARALYAEATAYAESRRAMLIIDVPQAVNTIDQMTTWMGENDSLRHPNGAVYFPRTFTPDPLDRNRPRSLAPSGTIAGLWARTDAQRGVWKAPAGTDARLRNVESLTRLMTDQENGVLNPLGVNCLRNFPVYSNICWGARTLEGADILASDWKYVPVRRTTLFLEESLYRGTKWVVFEPNDEPLWAQIRLNVGAFMQDLFIKGAFQGTTPRDAYFVRCDSTTTTQTDIDNGIVNIEVGFAPLKPAEFVILKIQQIVRRPEA
jgi:phage tail sheath protein FI